MKWFEGSIQEAVTASKAKKAVFVVFVEGKDEVSQQVAETLSSAEVSSKLESDKFVVIKLQSDSENYTFFAQIYQLVPVPSIFFIGVTGTPLEIVGCPHTPAELSAKIDSILLKANPQAENSSANLIDAEKINPSGITQESNPTTVDSNETEKKLTTNDGTAESDVSQEEKILRARKLIEMQNKKRQEDEERKEREREIERRKMGRDIQKLRQTQQEKEIQEAQQERMREKAAEKAARDKILKQIAEDKLERKRKYEKNQQEVNVEQQKKAEEAKARAKVVAATTDMSKARIQFKLPTGCNITGTFDSASTLGHLRTYVLDNAELPFRQFSMASCFPRRDFTPVDDGKTLLELELVPSAVILILAARTSNPASVVKSSDGAGIFSHFFWTLLAPVVGIYNYVVGYFSGRPRGDESDNSNENQNPGTSLAGNANLAFNRLTNMGMRRLGGQGTSKIRARGNVHTLHSGDNDNDENNTWNGNSTQQM